MNVLERLALGLAGIVGLGLLAIGGVVLLVREARARGAEERERDDLAEQHRRRARADAVRGRPLPTPDECDAWDRIDS